MNKTAPTLMTSRKIVNGVSRAPRMLATEKASAGAAASFSRAIMVLGPSTGRVDEDPLTHRVEGGPLDAASSADSSEVGQMGVHVVTEPVRVRAPPAITTGGALDPDED